MARLRRTTFPVVVTLLLAVAYHIELYPILAPSDQFIHAIKETTGCVANE